MRRSRLPCAVGPVWVCLLLAGCGTAETHRDARQGAADPPTSAASAPRPIPPPDSSFSTPGAFRLPLLGFVSFHCTYPQHVVQVEPIFDTRGSFAPEDITIRARGIERTFTNRFVGQWFSLPAAHYSKVTFKVAEGDMASTLHAVATVQFVDGRSGCYAEHWLASVTVTPG
jgi:hypothetical protein